MISGSCERVKRQEPQLDDDGEAYQRQICLNKDPGEWFRLDIQDCRDVVQCTEAVSVNIFHFLLNSLFGAMQGIVG